MANPRRRKIYGLIAIIVLVGLVLFAAPRSTSLTEGSTYNRAPDGYGAWYAYMEQQEHSVQRWETASTPFIEQQSEPPQTFLRIALPTEQSALSNQERAWVEQGNTWIILQKAGFPTEADFSSSLPTDQSTVKIETTRRHNLKGDEQEILGDRHGAIVWAEPIGKGHVIRSVTPFLAANAYQDEPGNFAYLAWLATQTGPSIWVDEVIHGRANTEEGESEQQREGLGGYLARTPLLPLGIQLAIIMLVLIWAKNRRFGLPTILAQTSQDNSKSYIQALAGVLEKAGRREFVVDVIGHEEQLQLQRSLGLGRRRLSHEAVINAWTQQTGRPAEELASFLATSRSSTVKTRELRAWIQQIEHIRDNAAPKG